jgi:hypothetical protein
MIFLQQLLCGYEFYPHSSCCRKVPFLDSYELTIVKVKVQTTKGKYNPETGRISFSNGLVGNYFEKVLMDAEMGIYLWVRNFEI